MNAMIVVVVVVVAAAYCDSLVVEMAALNVVD